jgi:hypothetical protein
MPIGEICNRDVVVAEKSLSVREAAQLMRCRHVAGSGKRRSARSLQKSRLAPPSGAGQG